MAVNRRSLGLSLAFASILAAPAVVVLACNTAELVTPNTIQPPSDELPPLCEAGTACDAAADAPPADSAADAGADATDSAPKDTGAADTGAIDGDAGPG